MLSELKDSLPVAQVTDMAKIEFAMLRHAYNRGRGDHAIQNLIEMLDEKNEAVNLMDPLLRAECYISLGMWEKETAENNGKGLDYEHVISRFEKATKCNPSSKEAWHYFAMLNYEAAQYYD